MNNAAIVCRIKNVRPHPNADKVQLATANNYQVIVGLDVKEKDLGLYFPTDTCLGKDFASANEDLLTYFDKNLRVRTQKFRGENSEGLWCPVSKLEKVTGKLLGLEEGLEITTLTLKDSNFEICKKYINPETLKFRRDLASKISKKLRSGSLPTFQKHVETSQLRSSFNKINRERQWIWTQKLHGTSQRIGNVQVVRELKWYEKLLSKLGIKIQETKYEYLVGTRNVILGERKEDGSEGKDGWYGDDFRLSASKPFLGKLNKGEVVYYEVVGYSAFNIPIMARVSVRDKDLKKLYGNEVTYSYDCPNGSFDIYVYRIAYQMENGTSIDLSWDQVKNRCKELGVKYVPEVHQFGTLVDLEDIQDYIEQPDFIDPSHPLEGVVLRIEGTTPEFYKEKSFTFKVLEGIIKDSGAVDLEDAS